MELEEKIELLGQIFARHGRKLYIVGGCVRDSLSGRRVTDYDLATDAVPDEIKRLVVQARPNGVYTIGEKFGTVGLIFGNHKVEITTFRSEEYQPHSRWPKVAFGQSLEEDLARRDFTINAIAQDILTSEIIDPFGGRTDLGKGLIRAVGDPQHRFEEDPLRLMRAVRFAAQLCFVIEEGTAEAIREHRELLREVSVERIGEEMNKILLSSHPAKGLRLACELGLMEWVIPELLPMRGLSQGAWHHKDVFEHTMTVVERIPADPVLRWAGLLHDIAKPLTISRYQDGTIHFYGHDLLGGKIAADILQRLHFDRRTINTVSKLVRMHMRVNLYDEEWTDGAVRRLIREAGEELPMLFALSRADITSYRPRKVQAALERVAALERRCRELMEAEDVAKLKSPLDGDELMALFNRPAGPWIRDVKDYLLNQVIEGKLAPNDKEKAADMARAFMSSQSLTR